MHLDTTVGLSFNGDCEAAFRLYESLLGAKAEPQPTFFAARYGEVVDRFLQRGAANE
jgi:uncharacterized glyoxalase superfamily protein PhnB